MSLIALDGKIIVWTIQKREKNGLLNFIDNQEVFDIGNTIMIAENYSGFMHIDFQMDTTTQEVFVLECNPRTWSSMNASILAGVNFIEYAVNSILQLPTEKQDISTESYFAFHKSFILLMQPWKWNLISNITRTDLRATLTDPIPYLLQSIFQYIKKLTHKI